MRLSEDVIRYLTIRFEVPVEGSEEPGDIDATEKSSAAPLGS